MPTAVGDRGDHPNRKIVWDVHNVNSGDYMYSYRGGAKVSKNSQHVVPDKTEVRRSDYNAQNYPDSAPKKRKFK